MHPLLAGKKKGGRNLDEKDSTYAGNQKKKITF